MFTKVQNLISQRPEVLKFGLVSGFNVVCHQVVFFVFRQVFDFGDVTANVVAAVITAVPAFVLSRIWVWPLSGLDWRKQVVPFWVIAILGVGVSSLMVAGASQISESTLIVQGASFVGYFLIWVVKFFVLDKFVFASNSQSSEPQYQITDCWNGEDTKELAETEPTSPA